MLRFTIRDVLWLMAVVAIGCASWLEHVDANRERASAKMWESRAEDVRGLLRLEGWGSGWQDRHLGYIKRRGDLDASGETPVESEETQQSPMNSANTDGSHAFPDY
jgi:hypothetical protein